MTPSRNAIHSSKLQYAEVSIGHKEEKKDFLWLCMTPWRYTRYHNNMVLAATRKRRVFMAAYDPLVPYHNTAVLATRKRRISMAVRHPLTLYRKRYYAAVSAARKRREEFLQLCNTPLRYTVKGTWYYVAVLAARKRREEFLQLCDTPSCHTVYVAANSSKEEIVYGYGLPPLAVP